MLKSLIANWACNEIVKHKAIQTLNNALIQSTIDNPHTSTGLQNAQDCAGQEIKEIKYKCMDRKE